MDDFVCRKATDDDLPAIGELWLQLAEYHRDVMPFPLVENATKIAEEHAKGALAVDDCVILVAERDGAILGYSRAAIRHHPPVFAAPSFGYLSELVVAATYRRQGVGERLFLATKAWFQDKGIARLEVGTATGNPVSNAFWEKMGFETYRETKQLNL